MPQDVTVRIEEPVKRKSAVVGMVWMFLISILLFWLPVVGAFLAGLVGGVKSGGLGAAITAVFLPGLIIGGLLAVLATGLTGIPVLGAVAGVGGFILAIAHVGPMLVGAIIGGIIA